MNYSLKLKAAIEARVTLGTATDAELAKFEALEAKERTEDNRKGYLDAVALEGSNERDIEMYELGVKRELETVARAAKTEGNKSGTGVEKTSKDEKKVVRSFSMMKAVRAAYGVEKLEGVELEMQQEAARELDGIGQESSRDSVLIPSMIINSTDRAAITVNGTAAVETRSFVDTVYAQTILGQLGVTRFDAVTTQRIPLLGAVTTQWEGETDAAADGGNAMTKKDLDPTRLATYVDFSKQSAMQHNESIAAALEQAMTKAIAAKVEYAVFTDDTSAGGPTFISSGKTALTNAAATGLCLDLIEQVLGNNHEANGNGFAIGHAWFSDMYSAVLATGVSPLVAAGKVLGRNMEFSTQIANIATKPAMYYGDWSYLNMAQFGGIEILLDPYTQKVSGQDRLIMNSFWDFALTRAAAISVGTLS